MGHSAGQRLPGDIVGAQLARLTTFCVRHAGVVVAVTLLASLALSAGIGQVFVHSTLTDWLSDSDPDKQAADRVMEKLPGVSTLEAVVLELDPARAGAFGITDVRQEGAIRAEEHLYQYLQDEIPEITGAIGLNHFVKLARYSANGNDDAAFAMPPESDEGSTEFQVYWTTLNTTVQPILEQTIRNPDYQSTLLALQFEADLNSPQAKEVAGRITDALEKWRGLAETDQVPARYDIWNTHYVYNVGPMSGIHQFETALREDLPVLVPAAFFVILASLWIGLRNPGSAVIGILTLVIATTSTVGLMGWLRFPFSVANVSMIPLIIGNGIDYAIHVLNEYSEERSKGQDARGAFDAVGRHAGVAMVLATGTSVIGILSMALSDSIALTQLAYSASFALLLVTLLALTFIPAASALWGDRMQVRFKETRLMPWLYERVNRHKAVTLLLFVAVSGVLYANTANLSYYTELTASNFPEGDHFREAYTHLTERQLGSADEVIIIEGDITDPATVEYIYAMEQALWEKTDIIRSRAHVNSITILLGAYEILSDPEDAAGPVGETALDSIVGSGDPRRAADEDYPRAARPTTRDQIEADLTAMQDSVAWGPLVDFLVSSDRKMTIIDALVDAESVGQDFEDLKYIHDQIEDVIEQAEPLRPDDVQTHMNGLSSAVYVYLDYSFYWLKVLFVVSAIASIVLVFLFTGSWRAVGATLVPMVFTSIWWFGLIAFWDIQVAISLIVPIIFITSIGSDYSAHLAWNILKTGDPKHVYRTTGKAILFSAITDFAAFFVFSFAYLTAPMADVALATAIAIATIFVVTMMIIPLFFQPKPPGDVKVRDATA